MLIGLGLAISSRLVELMGGRIWVESNVGEGSAFHFTAQFQVDRENASDIDLDAHLVGDTVVLVVDDNATNRRILSDMLRHWGMNPTAVASADEALSWLADAAATADPCRLVISDVNMPDVDGFTMAQRIRDDSRFEDLPIILLLSGERPGYLARCKRLVINAHMLKPVNQLELLRAVVRALRLSVPDAQQGAGEAAGEPATIKPLQILLAEDNVVNQKLAIGLLSRRGHQVTVVEDGKQAVQAACSQDFDLILMDVQMPEMDGFEATRAIREDERKTGKHIPIVAMTAYAMKGDRDRCLAAGMDDYLPTPIRIRDLDAKLERLFQSADNVGSSKPSSAVSDPRPRRRSTGPKQCAPSMKIDSCCVKSWRFSLRKRPIFWRWCMRRSTRAIRERSAARSIDSRGRC